MAGDIRAYLPSTTFLKKVGFLFAILVVGFGIAALSQYISKTRAAKQASENGAPSATPILVKNITEQDTNGNGIPDWIDHLSNDTITPASISGNTSGLPVNETDQFAHDLLATSASISEVAPLSSDGAQTIADQVTSRIAATDLGNETFSQSDITMTTETQKNRDTYIDGVSKLLNTTYPLDIDTSISILQDALNKGDATGLSALGPISDRYGKLITSFKKLPVPPSFADNHIAFMNVLGKARASIETMRNTFTNPVVTMGVFMNYPATINDLIDFISPFTKKIPYSTLVPTNPSTDPSTTN